MNEVVIESGAAAGGLRFSRASWGAILAGTLLTIILQIMLTLLGTAIGLASLNPIDQQNAAENMGLASGIWLLATTLVSVWVGACIAGRLSGGPGRADGMIHGIIAWSVATLVTLLLVVKVSGALLGGAGALLGKAFEGTGGENQNAIANAESQIKSSPPQGSSPLAPTGRPHNQQAPGRLTELAAQDPELGAALARLESNRDANNNTELRDQVVNLLATKHNVNRQEAANLVVEWDQQFQATRSRISEKARQIGQTAASGISQGALWGFIALFTGLLVSAWGGWSGAASLPRTEITTTPVVT